MCAAAAAGAWVQRRAALRAPSQRSNRLERPVRFTYEPPMIAETFDALDVLGSAEGFEVYTVGCGSTLCAISIAR
jgi:hypothetical protein